MRQLQEVNARSKAVKRNGFGNRCGTVLVEVGNKVAVNKDLDLVRIGAADHVEREAVAGKWYPGAGVCQAGVEIAAAAGVRKVGARPPAARCQEASFICFDGFVVQGGSVPGIDKVEPDAAGLRIGVAGSRNVDEKGMGTAAQAVKNKNARFDFIAVGVKHPLRKAVYKKFDLSGIILA